LRFSFLVLLIIFGAQIMLKAINQKADWSAGVYMPVVNVNYWALIACAVASMLIGWNWYGALFGRAWMKSAGIDMQNMHDSAKRREMQAQAGPGYLAMFIGSLVMAFVLKHFLDYAGADVISRGLVGAFWAWLGFIATSMLGVKFFEKKSWTYYLINSGYQLVNLLVYSIILVSWK
jgi:hypothetical protein